MQRRVLPGAVALYLLLATPPGRRFLEAGMATHMLVQIPLLVALGAAFGASLPARWRQCLLRVAGGPLPHALAASLALTYWMLPRALDAALEGGYAEAAKFAVLPLLAGVPLSLAWPRLTLVGRGFLWANLSSMLAVLGWLYSAAPQRVCNQYLLDQQASAGHAMIALAAAVFCAWLGSLFLASAHPESGERAD